MNLADVIRDFHDEETCVCFLETKRWPNGVECVECQSKKISRITSKGKTGKPRFVYGCSDCRQQFSVKSGTLFHDSHIPLHKWFMAIAIICQAKKGVSANQIGRTIGVSTKSAWYLCHRIRDAMNTGGLPKLNGILECDETFVGGKARGAGRSGRRAGNKQVVMGVKQRGGEVRYVHAPDVKAETWSKVLAEHVDMSKVDYVMTDDSTSLRSVFLHNPSHFVVRHTRGEYATGLVHTNSIESSFAMFKRGLVGSFHRLSSKHLSRYLFEFQYRHNNRKNMAIFEDVLTGIAAKPRLTLRALVDGKEKQELPF